MSNDIEYSCSVTLIILHDDIDPDVVTRELEMLPDKEWRKGEVHSFMRNDGEIIQFEDEYKWSGWKRFIDPDYENKPLEDQLEIWCDALNDRKQAISRLKSFDCYCTLDIFVTTDKTASIVIDEKLQNRLSSLGLDLRVSFWAMEES